VKHIDKYTEIKKNLVSIIRRRREKIEREVECKTMKYYSVHLFLGLIATTERLHNTRWMRGMIKIKNEYTFIL
jgi:ribosomal protein S3AE